MTLTIHKIRPNARVSGGVHIQSVWGENIGIEKDKFKKNFEPYDIEYYIVLLKSIVKIYFMHAISALTVLMRNLKFVWPVYVVVLSFFFTDASDWRPFVFEGGWREWAGFHAQYILAMGLVTLGIHRLSSGDRRQRPVWWVARLSLVMAGLAFMLDETRIFGLSQNFILVAGGILTAISVLVWWFAAGTGPRLRNGHLKGR